MAIVLQNRYFLGTFFSPQVCRQIEGQGHGTGMEGKDYSVLSHLHSMWLRRVRHRWHTEGTLSKLI